MASVEIDQRTHDIADHFFAAVSAGDIEAVRACYAPDVKVWHGFTNSEQSREENLALLTWVSQNWDGFRFEKVQRYPLEGGFIQRHEMHFTHHGEAFVEPSALWVWLNEDGTISRIEELFSIHRVPLPGAA